MTQWSGTGAIEKQECLIIQLFEIKHILACLLIFQLSEEGVKWLGILLIKCFLEVMGREIMFFNFL